MYNATVIVMNRDRLPSSGQGVMAVSPEGCFYLEEGMNVVRSMSLVELDEYLRNIKIANEEQAIIVALIRSAITTARNQGKTS